jgi:hypothetical protein
VVSADGTAAANLGSGAALPSPPPTAFGYFVQNTRIEIYGVPPDGQGGYRDVYLVVKVTAAAGAPVIQAKIDGKVSGPNIVPIASTCGDTANTSIFSGASGPVGGSPKVDDVPGKPY